MRRSPQMSDMGCTMQMSPSFQNDDQKKKRKMISTSTSLHFFQIIHSSIIQSKRLVLPKKFIMKFGEELSEVAVLMVPSGTIWRIELGKAEGVISFESGWPEFVDYYSIRVGHFLLFGYDGNSYFNVIIFDPSASEIEYPCHAMDFEEPNHETESQAPSTFETDSMEIPNVPFPQLPRNEDDGEVRVVANKQNESDQVEQKRRERFTFSFRDRGVISIDADRDSTQSGDETTMFTKRKSSSSRDRGVISIDSDSNQSGDETTTFTKRKSSSSRDRGVISIDSDCTQSDDETTTFTKRKSSSSRDRGVISIDSDSTQSGDETTMFIKRKSSSSRAKTDLVKACYSVRKSRTAELSARQVNRRTEPDGHDDLYLQEKAGAIVPTTRSYSTAMQATQVKEGALEAARAFKSDNPFFTVLMYPSSVDRSFLLNVPIHFAKVYLQSRPERVTLRNPEGRTWEVRCLSRNTYTKLTGGWKDFVLDNHLVEDDACVFELVDRNKFEINVFIFRVSENNV